MKTKIQIEFDREILLTCDCFDFRVFIKLKRFFNGISKITSGLFFQKQGNFSVALLENNIVQCENILPHESVLLLLGSKQ